jgi:hypothetical protein
MRVITPLALALAVSFALSASAPAQSDGQSAPPAPPGAQQSGPGAAQARAVRPAPRWPDGRVSFSGTPTDVGNWEGPADGTIFFNIQNGKRIVPRASLSTNMSVDQVPMQPWAREQYMQRQANLVADDPHARCKPSGGARFFHTPYGMEVLDLPETHEVIFLGVGSPHSWRIVYTDGREHPKDLKPSWYGHAVGHWDGDTLVIDSVGYNERFWLTREGVPHTSQLHLIERISRPNFNQLRYEATVEDPGAYTATWSGGWNLRWSAGNEPFDYLCQENNKDPARMVGPQ